MLETDGPLVMLSFHTMAGWPFSLRLDRMLAIRPAALALSYGSCAFQPCVMLYIGPNLTQVLIELPARGACNKHGCYARNYTDTTAAVIATLEAIPPSHVARMQRAIAINAHRSQRDICSSSFYSNF